MSESMTDIRLSVALVTRNRPDSLERTLKSLRAQSVQPWEVIVSDDSDEDNAEQTEQIASGYGCCYIQGPRRGLYGNRNHVASACRGTHIRTMDDDHEFPPRHIEHCLEALQNDPASIWVIGDYGVMKKEDMKHVPADVLPYIMIDTYSPDKIPKVPAGCPGQLNARGFSTAPKDTQNCWAIGDGATIYPREVFDRGILYTDSFKFGIAYLEFGSRLFWLGYRIRHLDTTYIIHHAEYMTSVWRGGQETELSSRFFAMLNHSFIYQPTLKNKILTCVEIFKQILLYRNIAIRALKKGIAAKTRLTLGHSLYEQAVSSSDGIRA